ncbi:MAG: putative metal-binding motif-containing protein, partial [Myxococcota bacterium]|nr:putative metal-binding motif-containing protein [Myxococcota bacterium]
MMALRPFLVVLWPALLVGCDGKSDTGRSNLSTDADGDGFPDGTDCDDADPAVHPDAVEVCDGIDNDCDALVDDEDDSLDMDTAQVFHADGDGDGFGDPAAAVSACSQPSGAVEDGTDCDDADPAVNPGAVEICDELDVDEDCSGVSDDADDGVDPSSASSWYADADGDGFGDAAAVSTSCDPGPDQVADATDCDDGDENIHPDATEVCDDLDVDEDCSGAADDADPGVDASSRGTWHTDADGDGFGDPATATSSCEAP